jgi:hypothetical protein
MGPVEPAHGQTPASWMFGKSTASPALNRYNEMGIEVGTTTVLLNYF